MEQEVFKAFKELIYNSSGIALSDEKKPLLLNRIFKRMRALGSNNPADYLATIRCDLTGNELIRLIDAVSTNVTYFYREGEHFAELGKIFDDYTTLGKKRIRLWCAAASSGEEPYTIAMVAREHLKVSGADFKILATDICTEVLQKAVRGVYAEKQLEKLPEAWKTQFFQRQHDGRETTYQIDRSLGQNIIFKQLNLIKHPYPLRGSIDIIFCRNVMIYFDVPTRTRIVEEFCRLLAPGGYLFLSRSENLLNIDHGLKKHPGSIYQKPL